MKWFKHQSDARNSLKLRKVRRKYGADGYAIYWFCLEAIAYDVDKDNLTFELKEDAETIAFELNIQEKRVEEIMYFMVEIGLFESSSNMITCMKLAESIDKSMTNSPKMRAWLETKSVMTLPDNAMTSNDAVNTCPELELEIEIEKKKKNKEPFDSFNFEDIKASWNELSIESDCVSKKTIVFPEKAKKDLPKIYKKYEAIKKSLGKEPESKNNFCKSYFKAVLDWAEPWAGKGSMESFKVSLEYSVRIDTFDKVMNWVAGE